MTFTTDRPGTPEGDTGLPTVRSLEELGQLVVRRGRLYVRWSCGPDRDLGATRSVDELTGIPMPGLSANPLRVEEWWGDRSLRLWVARRLFDYCHLRADRVGDVRPWTLCGREVGRGPDNEPLVRDIEPVSWIAPDVIAEAEEEVARQRRPWGPMRR
ncbi:DUF6098 family protein [Streptomyces sp. NPDC015131]|uniref:DUF6098 family protein n=1 Tax=Streptomyces sp. NPDC015131 TaxID=3364941 RepID=UPI003702F3E1